MNRSTLRSLSVVFATATAVVSVSLSPLAASAQTVPATSPAVSQVGTRDVIFGDADEGPIYVGPITVSTPTAQVVLAPGDVQFGDADRGAIAEGPAPATAASAPETAGTQAAPDLLLTDDAQGGMPIDLSAFRGRSTISAAELAGNQPQIAQNLADGAYQFVDAE